MVFFTGKKIVLRKINTFFEDYCYILAEVEVISGVAAHRHYKNIILFIISMVREFMFKMRHSMFFRSQPEVVVVPVYFRRAASKLASLAAFPPKSCVTVDEVGAFDIISGCIFSLSFFCTMGLGVTIPLVLFWWPGLLVAAEDVALVEVFLEQRPGVSALLQGEVVEASRSSEPRNQGEDELEGNLVLVRDEEIRVSGGEDEHNTKKQEPWIGVVPVEMDDSKASTGNQESFADAVVNKMKRALVLGASALIILALNQNTVREMDLSQVLTKPIIVIQTSENVTRLIGALIRGLRATARITYETILQDNLGATLTLWSSCGRSRGGLYGEWQGVICTGETNSQVQKYLQQLWDTVLLVALILCTGVIVQARWQYQDRQLNDDLELLPKQDVLKRMSSLQTKMYRQPKPWCDPSQPIETDNCAVCLEPFNNNQCLRVLPCLHEYHRDCVDPWLLLHHTCPLCKRSILGSICKDS
ncbi:RING finger protein 215 [Odontesthes bonariensis]|uniref:RING finger protein 215 n=1 Tax=Odontesthes bonariensis TaxID=219752 RepID=UPI003F58E10F